MDYAAGGSIRRIVSRDLIDPFSLWHVYPSRWNQATLKKNTLQSSLVKYYKHYLIFTRITSFIVTLKVWQVDHSMQPVYTHPIHDSCQHFTHSRWKRTTMRFWCCRSNNAQFIKTKHICGNSVSLDVFHYDPLILTKGNRYWMAPEVIRQGSSYDFKVIASCQVIRQMSLKVGF